MFDKAVRAKMSRLAAAIALCVVAFPQTLCSATLDIDFNVRTQIGQKTSDGLKHKDIVVFVVDRSGSMRNRAVEVGRPSETRDEVLKKMLKERMATIASMRPDAEVYLFPFASKIRGPLGPFSVNDSRGVLETIGRADGLTLLYDAMARAVRFSEEKIASDPSVRVWMYVYTDGANCTERTWIEEYEDKGLIFGTTTRRRPVRVIYPSDDADSAERFMRDHIGKIKDYAVNGKMALESGCWLGSGDPPKMIANKRKDNYKLELHTDGAELKNPGSTPSQAIKADLLLPIPSRCVKDLARLNAVAELDVGGRKFRNRISLNPGRCTARIKLPDDLPARAFQGKLSVVDLPDAWKDVAISSPEPVTVDFAAPGALSFVSVEPRESQLYVKVGDAVKFSAQAVEGAPVNWLVDGKKEATGSFSRTFDRAGSYRVTAVAQKSGFKDATATINVQAVDASVSVSVQPTKPVVGDRVTFSAKTDAKADRCSWSIDEGAIEEKSPVLKGHVFDRRGEHKVKVRVFFGHGITGECERRVDVAGKPFVKVVEPYSGQEFDFGTPVLAVANVDGEFDSIDWKVSGETTDSKSSDVDRKARSSRPVEFKSLKGGKYNLVAVVKGPAGELKSDPIPFSIKREDVMVRIDKPISGASVEVGNDLEMVATVKGQSVKEVKWTVMCKGKELFSTKKPVKGGVSSCVFKPNASLGNGAMLVVKAEDAADADVSSNVDVETTFFASLDIVSAKVGNRDANGLQASFGDQVALEASCKGGVDATKVEWVAEISGKERVIGNGLKVNAPKVSPDNSALVTAKYFARAKLPDGSVISSGKVTVFFACDDIIADIVLPKGADGLPQRSFKPHEKIHLQLVAEGGRLTDVDWDFGDGTTARGDNVEHAYSDEKEHVISAKGKCAKCGKCFSASVKISTACPDLELSVILPKGEDGVTRQKFGLKEPVNVELSVKDGEAADVVWDFGDGSTAQGAVASHVYGKYGKNSITVSARCKRCGKSYKACSEEIVVDVIPPTAKFEIKEKGSYYTVGSKLHLESRSFGDVEDLIWKVDGEELVEWRGKSEAMVKLPKRPCEMLIELQAIGPSGTEPSTASRDARVRYGWWAVVILVLLALLAIWVFAKLFLNNGPAGWKIKLVADYGPKTLSEKDVNLFLGKFAKGYKAGVVGHFWSLMDKFALMPIHKLAKYKRSRFAALADFAKQRCDPMAAIKVGLDNGKPYIKGSSIPGDNVLGTYVIQGDKPFQMFRQTVDRDGRPPVYLSVALDTNHVAHGYLVWFVIFTLAVIAGCAWAMRLYAI